MRFKRHALTALMGSGILAMAGSAEAQTPSTSPVINLDAVVVTASPLGVDRASMPEGSSVIEGNTLDRLRGVTIGETLDKLPGVSSTQFGAGASRPVIRGLGGGRVRTLSNGMDSFDVSVTSPDHQVATPAAGAKRIEVLRGPATLLYGSSAVGGVVNTIDDRIPEVMPKGGFESTTRMEYGARVRDLAAFSSATGAIGSNAAVHAEGFSYEADDYKANGFSSDAARNAGIKGRVRNSFVGTRGGSLGSSVIGDRGYGGAAMSQLNSTYAVPGNVTANATSIDMHQNRYDFKGGVYEPVGFLDEVRVKLGYGDYRHDERSGSAIRSSFFSKSWEGRGEFLHAPIGDLKGVFGVQAGQRDMQVLGDEAFLPPNVTDTSALFLVETYEMGPWLFAGGGRVERQQVAATSPERERKFSGRNASGSATFRFDDTYSLGFSASRTERLPSAEELFSNGPHDATRTFEIGDSNLRKEIAVNTELAFRKRKGDLTGGVSIYRTTFRDFISEQFTGETQDDLPVLRFSQTRAEFRGAEIEAGWRFFGHRGFVYSIDGVIDYVIAEDRTNNRPLPRIPPLGYTAGLNADGDTIGLRLEVEGASKQDRVSVNETTTNGYTLLNAAVTYFPIPDSKTLAVGLKGRNLTDEEGRNHVSFLKNEAPLRGREVWLTAMAKF